MEPYRFSFSQHDCRLVRLEAAFAPTILRLQNSLTTNAGSKVVTSAKFGNFLVSTSLARHEEFGKQAHVQPSNDPEKNLQKFVLEGTSCIPHVETQDAFLNGQLRYEICKERLMCCDVVPHGASTFLTELLPSCSTACLLTITVQNYSEFKGDKEAQLQSKSRTRVPLKERLNSLSVSDEVSSPESTGILCRGLEFLRNFLEFVLRSCSSYDSAVLLDTFRASIMWCRH